MKNTSRAIHLAAFAAIGLAYFNLGGFEYAHGIVLWAIAFALEAVSEKRKG